MSSSLVGAITVITSARPTVLGKTCSITSTGFTVKTTADLVEGSYAIATLDSLPNLSAILQGLGTNQAITNSLPVASIPESGGLITKGAKARAGYVSRTNVNFKLRSGQPGVLTLDYDPPKNGTQPYTREALWALLCSVAPELRNAGVLWWCSSSSYIYNGNELIHGLRGQRIYVVIRDAGDAIRAHKNLSARLWLAGHGRYELSVAGHRLERDVFDNSMAQDNKLDFMGGANCLPPLDQRRGSPVVLSEGGFADSLVLFPPLTEKEKDKVESLKSEARTQASGAVARVQAEYVAKTSASVRERLLGSGVTSSEAEARARQCSASALTNVLLGDFEIQVITPNGLETVTIAQVLQNKERYDGCKTLDPLEPTYKRSKEVGILWLYGTGAKLFSHAHGGHSFYLRKQPSRVTMVKGCDYDAVKELIVKMSEEQDIYIRGGVLVRAGHGRLFQITNTAAMCNLIGSRFALFRRDKDGKEHPTNLDKAVADQLLEAVKDTDLHSIRKINSLATLPLFTKNGIVTKPGFHASSGCYLDFDPSLMSDWNLEPTKSELVTALIEAWRPFRDYMFATVDDKGAALAAFLTVIARAALDKSPGFLVDAPQASSGKTVLAQSVGALYLGRVSPVAPFQGANEIEFVKTLIASAIAGSDFAILDNVVGYYDSAVMASLLTSGAISGRVLNASVMFEGEVKPLMFITSNNASISRDLVTRFCRIRIDTKSENPQIIEHDFDPLEETLENRESIGRALCVLAQGFLTAAPSQIGKTGNRFPNWGNLIRQCVLWVTSSGISEAAGLGVFGDPAKALTAMEYGVDPKTQARGDLLAGISKLYGDGVVFTGGELARFLVLQSQSETAMLINDGFGGLSFQKGAITGLTVSKLLGYQLDIPCNGLTLVLRGKKNNSTGYSVIGCLREEEYNDYGLPSDAVIKSYEDGSYSMK